MNNREAIEVWKDIAGYEGKYQISNLGRVKSLDRKFFNGKVMANKKGFVLKQTIGNTGYYRVRLTKNNVTKNFLVHRLVAMAFIENPKDLPLVNHMDENKLNNCAVNLEWCDKLYNNNYGTAKKRHSETARANPSKRIDCEYMGETHYLKEWARIKGIGYDKLKKRWDKGFRGEELFYKDDYSEVKYDFLGESHNLKEWSVIVGMKYTLFYSRWKRGVRGYELFRGYEDKLPRHN